ncbi:MAG: restriction endonuclease subunit S [Desulfosporosinus sp.]
MSKIENLIAELCPDGVEYKTIGEIAECHAGATPKTGVAAYWENGTIPWMSSGEVNDRIIYDTKQKITQLGYENCSTKMVPPNAVVVALAGQGKTRGTVAITRISLCTNQSLCSIITNESVVSDFLYYYLRSQYKELRNISSGDGTRGGLNLKMINNFKIPFPPLPVQQEIVRILDNFTKLEAELEAELEARKKQYEYYLSNVLLVADSNCKYQKIGDVCLKTENISWSRAGDTVFKYIDLTSVDRDTNAIGEVSKINADTAPSRAQKIVAADDIIFGTTRPTLKRFCIIPNNFMGHICSTGFCVLRTDKTKVLPKFLYYHISKPEFYDYIETVQRGSAYPAVSDVDVKNFKIPIPPLAEQERIVTILDRFDALVNDITQGLPAEIMARRKQYEYYRDKLLNFKEKVS